MFFRLCSAIFLLFSTSAYAVQFPLELIDRMDDSKIVIYANKDDINKTSVWNINEGNPPLTIGELVSKVNNWIETHPYLLNSTVNEIELKKVHHYEEDNYWYYLVQLKNAKNINYIGVLMNGKILAAIKEPASYK